MSAKRMIVTGEWGQHGLVVGSGLIAGFRVLELPLAGALGDALGGFGISGNGRIWICLVQSPHPSLACAFFHVSEISTSNSRDWAGPLMGASAPLMQVC